MKIYFQLASRNIWRSKRRTLITISSVLFAVLFAVLLTAIDKGSYDRMIESIVKYSTGYIQIQDVLYDDEPSMDNSLYFDDAIINLLNEYSEQFYYVPRIQSFALVATDNNTRGTMVIGIEPESEAKLNDVADKLVKGEFIKNDDDSIVIAEGLANILNIGVGDTLVLLGQGFQGVTAAGKYRVKGIVNLRLPEMNNNTIYMTIHTAQWFFMAENRLTSVIVMPYKPKHTIKIANELQEKLDSEWYSVLTWEYMLSDLLKLMKFDMGGSMVILMILYIVIAFGLFGTIHTMMLERQKEFGMLISLGMKRLKLAIVCFIETLYISFIGVIIGIVVSIPIVYYYNKFPIELTGEMAKSMEDYGFEPIMPFSLTPEVFLTQAQIILILSLIIGVYPIYKIFKLNIMEVKQH